MARTVEEKKNTPLTVADILKEWLKENGYDGLCNTECGCSIEDFAPCNLSEILDCIPAYSSLTHEGHRCFVPNLIVARDGN